MALTDAAWQEQAVVEKAQLEHSLHQAQNETARLRRELDEAKTANDTVLADDQALTEEAMRMRADISLSNTEKEAMKTRMEKAESERKLVASHEQDLQEMLANKQVEKKYAAEPVELRQELERTKSEEADERRQLKAASDANQTILEDDDALTKEAMRMRANISALKREKEAPANRVEQEESAMKNRMEQAESREQELQQEADSTGLANKEFQ